MLGYISEDIRLSFGPETLVENPIVPVCRTSIKAVGYGAASAVTSAATALTGDMALNLLFNNETNFHESAKRAGIGGFCTGAVATLIGTYLMKHTDQSWHMTIKSALALTSIIASSALGEAIAQNGEEYGTILAEQFAGVLGLGMLASAGYGAYKLGQCCSKLLSWGNNAVSHRGSQQGTSLHANRGELEEALNGEVLRSNSNSTLQ